MFDYTGHIIRAIEREPSHLTGALIKYKDATWKRYMTDLYCKILYSTVRTVPCFGMTVHPGRDTDVISRPSKSTIEDLSFYIGFTRIGSWTLDLGPGFGINGHFRRDPDVISRLSESTTDFLSAFIGFGS